MADNQLANLVNMDAPDEVLREVLTIADRAFPALDAVALRSVFDQVVGLYQGAWEEVQGCNTGYHDLKHVTDCFLAMARLLHGALEAGFHFSERMLHRGLVAALLHDVGYLQSRGDTSGSGAKYTLTHVQRSMDFVYRYRARFGLQERDAHACMVMIDCTDLNGDVDAIAFPGKDVEQIGKMLATADILAQMADRTYLEKLLLLYDELEEARIADYRDDIHLLSQSEAFYQRMEDRFKTQLASANRFMTHHFRARWALDEDLYQRAIDNQQAYLKSILTQTGGGDPRDQLRRSGIVETVRTKRR